MKPMMNDSTFNFSYNSKSNGGILVLELGLVDAEDEKNKPHADWTYLIVKVRTSVRTNERTNEKAISVMFLCEKEKRNMLKKSKENLQKW